MIRYSARFWRPAALACAGALLFCAPALGQGAGFEAAPGSSQEPVVTSNGMPVVNTAPATPASGVAAQGDYGAFGGGAPPGMYVAPLGYGAPSQSAPAYSAGAQPPLSPTPGYSIQAPPITGPYAGAPQPYPSQPYLPPPPQAYGAPTPDYTLQGYRSPYAQPYPQPSYAPPPAYAQEPLLAATQPSAQSPYTAAQRMVQQLPPGPQPLQPQPQPQPMQPAPYAPPAAGPATALPYSSGTTAYGAPLPRNISMPSGQQPDAAHAEGGYTLGPGDKVRVTVYGEADLSGEFQVDGNGNLRLPLVGLVRASGYTAGGLEGWIRAALSPNYLRNPRINVEITGYRPVYVVGAVQKPGQYTYINDMTLLNAISLAGGFTTQAKESTVYVRHEGAAEEVVVRSAVPLLIRPGDTVRVDTTLFWDTLNMFSPLSSPIGLAAAVR